MFRARSAVHCVCIAGSGPEQNTGRTEHYTKYVRTHNNAPWAKEHRHFIHIPSSLYSTTSSKCLLASPCPCPCAQHTMCLTFCNPSVGTHSHPPTALSVPRKSPLQFAFVPAPALPNEPTQHHHPQPPLPLRALPFSRIILNFGPICELWEDGKEVWNGQGTMQWWWTSQQQMWI